MFLKKKEKYVLEEYEAFVREHKKKPKLKEISEKLNITRGYVCNILKSLKDKGYLVDITQEIQVASNHYDDIELKKTGLVQLPVLNIENLSVEHIEDVVSDTNHIEKDFILIPELFLKGKCFSIRASEKIMLNSINNGDIIVISCHKIPYSGDIIFCMIKNKDFHGFSLNYIEMNNDIIYLYNGHKKNKPIVIHDHSEIRIFGKVLRIFYDASLQKEL